jgi:hypothetical protein
MSSLAAVLPKNQLRIITGLRRRFAVSLSLVSGFAQQRRTDCCRVRESGAVTTASYTRHATCSNASLT